MPFSSQNNNLIPSSSPNPDNIYLPLSAINTFITNWIIKCRVVAKSSKVFLKGGNSLFHLDLADKDNGLIRAKFWGDSAEKWFPLIENGEVYTFSKGRILVANKRFNTVNHAYELLFDVTSKINLVKDDQSINAHKSYSILNLRDVINSSKELPFITDLLVFITDIGNSHKSTGSEREQMYSRRMITVIDDSGYNFVITLWNKLAEDESLVRSDRPCIISNVRIKEWNDARVGQSTQNSEISYDFESKRVEDLIEWMKKRNESKKYTNNESNYQGIMKHDNHRKNKSVMISELKSIMQSNPSDEGFFVVKGRVKRIYYQNKEGNLKITYPACSKCNKKASENNEIFSCEICNESPIVPSHRYIFALVICDFSDQMIIRLFHNQGLQFLKISPDDLVKLKSKDDIEALFEWKLLYKEVRIVVKSKRDNYSGDGRLTHIAMNLSYINYHDEAIALIDQLKDNTDFLKNQTSQFKKNKMVKA